MVIRTSLTVSQTTTTNDKPTTALDHTRPHNTRQQTTSKRQTHDKRQTTSQQTTQTTRKRRSKRKIITRATGAMELAAALHNRRDVGSATYLTPRRMNIASSVGEMASFLLFDQEELAGAGQDIFFELVLDILLPRMSYVAAGPPSLAAPQMVEDVASFEHILFTFSVTSRFGTERESSRRRRKQARRGADAGVRRATNHEEIVGC